LRRGEGWGGGDAVQSSLFALVRDPLSPLGRHLCREKMESMREKERAWGIREKGGKNA